MLNWYKISQVVNPSVYMDIGHDYHGFPVVLWAILRNDTFLKKTMDKDQIINHFGHYEWIAKEFNSGNVKAAGRYETGMGRTSLVVYRKNVYDDLQEMKDEAIAMVKVHLGSDVKIVRTYNNSEG